MSFAENIKKALRDRKENRKEKFIKLHTKRRE